MRESYLVPATTANQITKAYYYFLVGQINRGTCSKKVCRVVHGNGSCVYETYHLVSI